MKHLLSIIIFLTSLQVISQTNLDSLWNVWNDAEQADTNRLKAIQTISREGYLNSQPDSAFYWAQFQYDLAVDKNLVKYQASALLTQGQSFYNQGDFNKAKELTERSLEISKTLKDQYGIAGCLNIIGSIHFTNGNYTKSQELHTRSLKIYEEIGDKNGRAQSLTNIANVLYKYGDYAKAIKYYTQSLKINEEMGEKSSQANNLNSIGNLYFKLTDFTKAMEYYSRSLKINEKLGNKLGVAMARNNIANIYNETFEYEKAIKSYADNLITIKELGNKFGLAITYNNLADIYYRQNLYKKALEYTNRSIAISKEIGDQRGIMICLNRKGKISSKKGNFSKAIKYNKKALRMAQGSGSIAEIEGFAYSLYENYKETGSHGNALKMHELFIEMRDSMQSETNQKEIINQEYKYQYDKKAAADSIMNAELKKVQDAELKAEQAENKHHKLEAEKQKQEAYLLYGGLSIALLFGGFIFNRFRIARSQKLIIEHQKGQIVESINYSKKIQDSILPSLHHMNKYMEDLFVFFKPKDIVSGDFYWHKSFGKYTILACVDCTGHGVPGAFMSTLGSLLMDKVIGEKNLSPAEILSDLSDEIILALRQVDEDAIQDGMDMSLCLINRETNQLDFCGARNGIIIISNGKPTRYKADLLPVGGNYLKKGEAIERKFNTQSIPLSQNDWVFMYTDGFMEQIGGKKDLPMNYAQFENILINVTNTESAEAKNELLQSKLDLWRGENKRVDDVLIMGFRTT